VKNLELKLKIESINEIRNRLADLGIKFESEIEQRDIYFSVSEGLLKLRVMKDISELIRYKRDEGSENRWSNYEILEVSGDDPEGFLRNFLVHEVTVEKVRELYMFGRTRIHLDRVKNLGCFLELESVVSGSDLEAKREFDAVVEKLHLDLNAQLKCSYHDLILEKI